MEYTIDAKNKSLGRIATEIALKLRGKNSPQFKPNVVPDNVVKVINASGLNISEKKAKDKIYTRFSGYPGGKKEISMEKILAGKGHEEVIRKAVRGMLPANRLRSRFMKNLIIEK